MTRRFEGQVAVITGSAGGLGRALALGFAAEGAEIVLVDLDVAGLDETARRIGERGGKARAKVLDLGDEAAIAALGAELCREHPAIRVLINNAGIAYGEINGPVDSLGMSAWSRYLAVNTIAPLLLGKALMPALSASRGSIINMSSMASFNPGSAYGVTKAALNAVTHGMADAFGKLGVRVNAIAPGLIETPASSAHLTPETLARIRAMQLIDGHGIPDHIVALALFLCSEEASFITADIVPCDGGSRVRGFRN